MIRLVVSHNLLNCFFGQFKRNPLLYGIYIVSGKIDVLVFLFFFSQNSLICFWTLTLCIVVKSRSMLFTLSNLPLFLGNGNSCIL